MSNQSLEDQARAKLADPKWRLDNLYYIKDTKGNKVKFKMNPEQEYLFNNLHYFNIIPKARQIGITTFFCILYFDQILWSQNKKAIIIADTKDHAKEFFRDKVKFAYDNFPDWVKTAIGKPNSDTKDMFVFPNGSSMQVTVSARSGTCQYLHISEFGPICARRPDAAKEIVTGSINTAHQGESMVSVESTAEGSDGYFFDFCMKAKQLQDSKALLGPMDWKLFFFPWYTKTSYDSTDKRYYKPITTEYKKYFTKLKDEEGVVLSQGQKQWYMSKKGTQGDDMFKEYPSTLQEAFQAQIDGAYYGSEMTQVDKDKRIGKIPYRSELLVDTWWDLGMNDNMVILFTQTVGSAVNIIDYYTNSGEGLSHYVNILRDRGYRYNTHNMPHDVKVQNMDAQGLTRLETFTELGLINIHVAPKIPINDGIALVRKLFSRLYFDEEKCDELQKSMRAYKRQWDERRGTFKDKPFHDKHSHNADAVRVLGTLYNENIHTTVGGEQKTGTFF